MIKFLLNFWNAAFELIQCILSTDRCDTLWRHPVELKKKFQKNISNFWWFTWKLLVLSLSLKKKSSCFKLILSWSPLRRGQSVCTWEEPGEQMALHIILIPGWSAEICPWGGNLLEGYERKLDRGPRLWSTHTSSTSSINRKVLLHLLLSAFMVTIRVGPEVLCNQGTFCFNACMLTTATTQNFLWPVTGCNSLVDANCVL